MKSKPLDRVAIFCAQYLIAIIVALAFVFSFLYSVPFIPVFAATLCAWGIAFVLQQLIRRPRPFEDGSTSLIQMWLETPSFPSAHSTIAFALAGSFLWAGVVVAPVLLILAAVLAWSRVRVRVHYASDVIAGAVIGLAVSYAFRLL